MYKRLLAAAIVVIIFAVIGFLLFNNSESPIQTLSGKIHVSTSFYPLFFLASEIGGDKADVTNITPAGAEPHDYEPTARDMATIERSDILILNGDGLEAWGSRVRKNANLGRTLVVTAGEGLATNDMVEDGKKVVDPHVWLSPVLAGKMVDIISEAFRTTDPSNTSYYDSRAQELKSKLSQLDREYAQTLGTCERTDIITSHAAFGYLASEYGLNQMPITGISPGAEPSPKELAEITTFAKAHAVQYIFFESLVSPKLARTIATEIGAQTLVLNPIEGLSEDDIQQGKNYFTEMQANLVSLSTALQCKK